MIMYNSGSGKAPSEDTSSGKCTVSSLVIVSCKGSGRKNVVPLTAFVQIGTLPVYVPNRITV